MLIANISLLQWLVSLLALGIAETGLAAAGPNTKAPDGPAWG